MANPESYQRSHCLFLRKSDGFRRKSFTLVRLLDFPEVSYKSTFGYR
jgi:hypothetical protein